MKSWAKVLEAAKRKVPLICLSPRPKAARAAWLFGWEPGAGGGGIGGWQNAAESRNVTRELVKRGYSEQDIQKIWSGNLLRVWRAVEAVSAAW